MTLLYTRSSTKSADEIGEKLQHAAAERGCDFIHIIDVRETMRHHDIEFGRNCRIYEVFNPRRAKGMLLNQMSVSTVLPCRISVYEENGKTMVVTVRPTVFISIFQVSELWLVAHQIQEDLKAIIDASVA